MKKIGSGLGSTLILLGGMTSCNIQKQEEFKRSDNRPNIILFLTDDNAFTYWGFGGGPDLSPTIDQIASQGIQASEFYCTSAVCTPSRYSLHTGKYAGRCTDTTFLREFPEDVPYNITWNTFMEGNNDMTLGKVLQEAGYKTGFVGKWHLGFNNDDFNLPHDADPFDPEVDKVLKSEQKALQEHIRKTAGFDYVASAIGENNDDGRVDALQFHNLEWLAKGARDFIEMNKTSEKPFFLIINITTHHGPCHMESIDNDVRITHSGVVEGLDKIMPPRSSIYERIMEKGYPVDFKTAGTVWTDDCVSSVLDKLDDSKLTDETAVIFTTDHNRYDGKATCYQGGVHIPFLMKWPGVIEPGSETNKRMQLSDLLPTLAEIAGASLPQDVDIDGRSRLDYFLNPKELKRDTEDLYFEFGYTRAVLSGKWKYIALRFPENLLNNMKSGSPGKSYNFRGMTFDEPCVLRYPYYFDADQLYNIEEDPEEQHNLAYQEEYNGMLKQMRAKLSKFTQEFKHPFALENPDPFYTSPEYRKLNENARNIDMDKFYWYRKGCY